MKKPAALPRRKLPAGNSENVLRISQESIESNGGIVLLPLKEYQKLLQRAAPAIYLKGSDAKELDRLVNSSLKEHKQGKTKSIRSLADLDS